MDAPQANGPTVRYSLTLYNEDLQQDRRIPDESSMLMKEDHSPDWIDGGRLDGYYVASPTAIAIN
jgi:hypothetical protein